MQNHSENDHLVHLPKVTVFFSHGIGIKDWEELGILQKEVAYYRQLRELVGEISLFTYDGSATGVNARKLVPDLPIINNSYRINYRLFGLLGPLLAFRTLRKSDVFKTNQLSGSWAGLLAKIFFRKPLIARCGYIWSLTVQRQRANWLRYNMIRLVERFVLRRADRIVVATERDAAYLASLHGVEPEKFFVLPNPVDTEQFSPGSYRDSSRFVFVGRMHPEKRPELAAAGIALVARARLDLFGDGEELPRLKATFSSNDRINFHGAIPNSMVAETMRNAYAIVATSEYEGSPKAVLEAMASGTPVIAAKVPGLEDMIEDGETGLLVDATPHAVAEAAERLISDRELWEKISSRALEWVVQRHSQTAVVALEAGLIRDVASRRSGLRSQ